MTALVVDGEVVVDLRRFSLRWVYGQEAPVLYCDGKRVTKAWKMTIMVESPADPFGGNANTD